MFNRKNTKKVNWTMSLLGRVIIVKSGAHTLTNDKVIKSPFN